MTDPDTTPTPKDFGEPDVPLPDEYEQHAREEREREFRERAQRAHEKAKARKEGRS